MAEFTGKVRWFNPSKGYGFLGRNSGTDVFVHYSAIESGDLPSMKEGEWVSFDIHHSVQGPQAAQVQRLNRDLQPGIDVDALRRLA